LETKRQSTHEFVLEEMMRRNRNVVDRLVLKAMASRSPKAQCLLKSGGHKPHFTANALRSRRGDRSTFALQTRVSPHKSNTTLFAGALDRLYLCV
jgi:hypothetical protein